MNIKFFECDNGFVVTISGDILNYLGVNVMMFVTCF